MPSCPNDLTQEELKSLLHYDPDSGVFTRGGEIAGSMRGHRYVRIHVAGFLRYGHRLAWLYMTGEWPEKGVDHRDGDGMNNRWKNLRQGGQALNLQNLRESKGPTSKYLGVCWHAATERWRSTISKNGKQYGLGFFDSEEEAFSAYVAAKRRLHEFCEI